MSGKGAPPPAAAADFEAPDYDWFDVARETAVQDGVEGILDNVNEHIDLVETQRDLLTTAVDECMTSCLMAVDMLYVPRDEAGVSSISISNKSWEPDIEPQPCEADAWLRCAVPALYPRVNETRLERSVSRKSVGSRSMVSSR